MIPSDELKRLTEQARAATAQAEADTRRTFAIAKVGAGGLLLLLVLPLRYSWIVVGVTVAACWFAALRSERRR